MQLDKGICTIFRKVDISEKGRMPVYQYNRIGAHWYGELEYATVPSWPTDGREETQVDARIRILQDRRLNNHDVVVLANVPEMMDAMTAFEIIRAYHGRDNDSGENITDLSLRRVRP